jgi:hypothetical protein
MWNKASVVVAMIFAITSAGCIARDEASDPIRVCRPIDLKTKVPVWLPDLTDDDTLSQPPPQKNGMLVYIELNYQSPSCDNEKLHSFLIPHDPGNAINGGLQINIRGNAQGSNGFCRLRGYYINESVMGLHQGWVETYFGAVELEKIVLSDKFCLERRID